MQRRVRQLNKADAEAYWQVRLRALREHPEAYGATAEEWQQLTVDDVAQRLRQGREAGLRVFGAFVEERLVGLAGFAHTTNNKQQHRGGIYQMYVAPEERGNGLGHLLLEAIFAEAQQQSALEELVLAVTVGNQEARALYLKSGFVPMYIQPRYLKIDGRYYDIEWMSKSME